MEANLLFFVVFISLSLQCFFAQPQPQPALPPAAATCDGIFISYAHTVGYPIPPPESNPSDQPYRFESTLRVRNNGLDELKSWQVFVGFRNREILVSADGAVLADGTSLPAHVGNGVVLAGMPKSDLKSAVETAGDLDQMEARVALVGTQFGVGTPAVPMPANITLVNDGYSCPTGPATNQGNNEMHVCCSPDPSSRSNITKDILFLPRQEGDLIIMYDVISSDKDENYLAQVTISNNNSLGRLDNWRLTWDWMREEFIYSMKGAYPEVVDSSDCLFGRQGQHYKGMDFSKVLNCERRPKIMDLPPTRANDTEIGLIPFCCRNGTILPPRMDPSKSVSAFQMQVFKMPPDLNRTELNPPVNWNITGTLSPDYQCGQPVRVSPSHFIDASGLPSTRAAVASWQVVCNITQVRRNPRCCVSFSSFSNESAVPCNTCACGCSSKPSQTCSATTPSLLVPPDVLLKPFDNRTKQTKSWYNDIKHWEVPDPLPCGDNCGVSINWHLLSDFRDGWSSRITVFNWGETAFADWFAAVELENAAPGFEAAYSLNATALNLSGSSNDTVFMHGRKDFNFLLPETESKKPKKDPPVPGTQQSVISFTKKKTPGIRVVKGDGFPTRVFFNGEECALPTRLPTNNASKYDTIATTFNFLALAALVMIIQLGLC